VLHETLERGHAHVLFEVVVGRRDEVRRRRGERGEQQQEEEHGEP
jgi:hypothetical protein